MSEIHRIDISNDTLAPIKETASFIELHFLDTKYKKTIFPQMEAQGYRMYVEKPNSALFFLAEKNIEYISDYYDAGAPEITEKLNNGKWKKNAFTTKFSARFIRTKAPELLNANRFDIAIKAHYGRLFKENMAKNWREHAYFEQALRITGPGKNLVERDGSGKSGLDEFLKSFHALLHQKNSKTFPYFPIDRNLIALDGAHRIAACIINNWDINAVQFDTAQGMPSTAAYYAGTDHGHTPCPTEILDEAAIEYTRIKNSCAIALIFPSAVDSSYALSQLKSFSDIVYQKEIMLSPKAGKMLLQQVYIGEEWVHTSDGFNHKAESCFPFTGKLLAVLIDNFDIRNIRNIKEKIRTQYNLGKHSIHITDSAVETQNIAKVLFNTGSVELLKRHVKRDLPEFHKQLASLKTWMEHNNINCEHLCVTSSAVLSAYGLRECRDIDFLYHGTPDTLPPLPDKIGSHNDYAALYPEEINDIMGDPRLHFWYMGVKFCTPAIISDMKKVRGEAKDKIDIARLRLIQPHSTEKIFKNASLCFINYSWKLRSSTWLFISRVKNKLRRILKGTS